MPTTQTPIQDHPVVSHAAWLEARTALLAKEKELTLLRDEIARTRRALPWERVEKSYTFEAPGGKKSLPDLFAGASQLIVYHFMLGPGWSEGCPGCSFVSDHIDGALPHLRARDASLVVVSRAPLAEIEPFKKRMGWRFPWVSSAGTSFNFDFGVSFNKHDFGDGKANYNYATVEHKMDEAPGASVFYKRPDGAIFHTYSTYARGLEPLVTTYDYLDMLPKGRDEDALEMPMSWVRHHDKYEGAPKSGCCCTHE